MNLIKIWKFKVQLANGRPFKAIDDLTFLTADSIFESGMGITGNEKNLVRSLELLKSANFLEALLGDVFPFPDYKPEGLLQTILTIAYVAGDFPTAPIIQLHWPISNFRPQFGKAQSERRRIVKTHIDRALRRWDQEGPPAKLQNATEFMISRERAAAKKDGR